MMAEYINTVKTVGNDGTITWRDENNVPHREGDQPAVIYPDGSELWFIHGEYHRDGDKPAAIMRNGEQLWAQHGKFHREGDQPALIKEDGTLIYYKNNQIHREDDKPAIEHPDGTKQWIVHDKLHRKNGLPTLIYGTANPEKAGIKVWHRNDVEMSEEKAIAYDKKEEKRLLQRRHDIAVIFNKNLPGDSIQEILQYDEPYKVKQRK